MSKLRLFTILLLSSTTCDAQMITFQKVYSGYGTPFGEQSIDSSYLIASGGGNGAMLMEADKNGNIIFYKSYASPNLSNICWAHKTADKGYVLIGSTYDNSSGNDEFGAVLIKTDSVGNKMWARHYLDNLNFQVHSAIQTLNGDYIFAGISGNSITLMKTDNYGDVYWCNYLSSTNVYRLGAIQQTSDSGYIITGTAGPDADLLLLRTDSNGVPLWSKIFGGPGQSDDGHDVQQTSDGGFIAVGETYANSTNAILIKTNSLGDTLWTKVFGPTINGSKGLSVEQTPDGGYIVSGFWDNYPNKSDAFIMKTDSNGNYNWMKLYGGNFYDEGHHIIRTLDGGFASIGWASSFSAGNFYLIKTDSLGNSGCYESIGTVNYYSTPSTVTNFPFNFGVSINSYVPLNITTTSGGTEQLLCSNTTAMQNLEQENICSFSPNPFTDILNINLEYDQMIEFYLYDITSRILVQKSYKGPSKINMAGISKGLYFYQVRSKNKLIKAGKLIKE